MISSLSQQKQEGLYWSATRSNVCLFRDDPLCMQTDIRSTSCLGTTTGIANRGKVQITHFLPTLQQFVGAMREEIQQEQQVMAHLHKGCWKVLAWTVQQSSYSARQRLILARVHNGDAKCGGHCQDQNFSIISGNNFWNTMVAPFHVSTHTLSILWLWTLAPCMNWLNT